MYIMYDIIDLSSMHARPGHYLPYTC